MKLYQNRKSNNLKTSFNLNVLALTVELSTGLLNISVVIWSNGFNFQKLHSIPEKIYDDFETLLLEEVNEDHLVWRVIKESQILLNDNELLDKLFVVIK